MFISEPHDQIQNHSPIPLFSLLFPSADWFFLKFRTCFLFPVCFYVTLHSHVSTEAQKGQPKSFLWGFIAWDHSVICLSTIWWLKLHVFEQFNLKWKYDKLKVQYVLENCKSSQVSAASQPLILSWFTPEQTCSTDSCKKQLRWVLF